LQDELNPDAWLIYSPFFFLLASLINLRKVKRDTIIAKIKDVACRYGMLSIIKLDRWSPQALAVSASGAAFFIFNFEC